MGKREKAVTYAQIRRIYMSAGERGMDNDLLHEHLEMLTGKESIRALSVSEAALLIDSLEGKTAGRPAGNRATSRQMYYIYGLMKELNWITKDGKPDMDRLNHFLQSDKTGFKLADYRWLDVGNASRLIEALKAISARGQAKKVAE